MHLSPRSMKRFVGCALVLTISLSSLSAQQAAPSFKITPDVQAALDHISADSLRGHLSFIASDALEGRNTPSRGLDIAAQYIAAQFRRAGLEPAGDDGYFQTANWLVAERNLDHFELKIDDGKETISIGKTRVSLQFDGALALSRAHIIKVDYKDAAQIAALTVEQTAGKVVITEIPRPQPGFMSKMSALKVALVLSVDRMNSTGGGAGPARLIDPENRQSMNMAAMIRVNDPKIVALYDALKPGVTSAEISLQVPAPVEHPVKLRNVIGILRGSDPALKNTYVMVTAHYDHLGMRPDLPGDNIYNGANDDGSGTVSVIELAAALATLKERPKRSLVFMTFFGEEKGLRGSRYYGKHPVFPIEQTVADMNLEQVGRTDSDEGPQVSNASMTGYDFSDVGETFKAAGALVGVKIYKHERNSDAFFGRSDNQALADQGVPAHTLCVAYVYPDYHGLGDHWDKIDYANMANVNRGVALGLLMIADNPEAPKWNEANPKAASYVTAWRARHGKAAGESK